MHLPVFLAAAFGALVVSASTPTKTVRRAKRDNNGPGPQFVTTRDGEFSVNGSDFRFVGTNAYWLPTLNSDQDIIDVFGNMSAAGIKVVKTYAFNDVETIPENGTWFQLIANGSTTINNGTNGFPKLDTVIREAEKHGIYLVLSLTNNWNPRPLLDNLTTSIENLTNTVLTRSLDFERRDVTVGTNNSLPRNTLSNDFGGIDVYVRQYGLKNHDEFYTNETLLTTFENYTTQIVSRYVNSPAVFSWEIVNDPRCFSSVPSSDSCDATTITRFMSRLAKHIRSIDPNHLVTSGSHGFLCTDCPKLFPRVVPSATPSPAPGARRRNVPAPLTKVRILQERKEARKKTRRAADVGEGVRIRGRWISTPTRRQEDLSSVGTAFDGSQGVDSEDVINIPEIGYGTFQLFPDQNTYGTDDPNLPALNNTINNGITWITRQGELASLYGKPVTLTGFGLVTQDNAGSFVPFNSSVAPFGPDSTSSSTTTQPYGVTTDERNDAYSQWFDAGISSGLQGIMQYQWGQGNLTASEGTSIVPDQNSTAISENQNSTGISPNDGYTIQGQGVEEAQDVISTAAQSIGTDADV